MDTGIGMILDDLKARNLLEDTVVIYTSDQGPGFTRAKTTCYEAGLRVPLIIRMPGGEPAEVWPGMVSLVDLAPTIFDLVGVTAPPGLAGRSLAGLLRGGTLAERKHLFSEYNAHGYGQSYLRRAVRGERYKLIHNLQTERPNPIQGIVGCAAWEESRRPALAGTIVRAAFDRYAHPPEFELYDLWADPWEFNNLAGKPKFADVQAELQSVLAEWRKQTNDPGEIER
jgi:N-sulfoglucosamine sulfohydrolase